MKIYMYIFLIFLIFIIIFFIFFPILFPRSVTPLLAFPNQKI